MVLLFLQLDVKLRSYDKIFKGSGEVIKTPETTGVSYEP